MTEEQFHHIYNRLYERRILLEKKIELLPETDFELGYDWALKEELNYIIDLLEDIDIIG